MYIYGEQLLISPPAHPKGLLIRNYRSRSIPPSWFPATRATITNRQWITKHGHNEHPRAHVQMVACEETKDGEGEEEGSPKIARGL